MLKGRDIILVSSCNYVLHTKNVLNAQIIADELSNAGNKVLFVESLGLKTLPLIGKTDYYKVLRRLFDFILLIIRGVSKPKDNVFVLSLIRLPFENSKFIKVINQRFITFLVRKYSKKYLSGHPILWIFLPTGHFLIDTVSHSVSIYHCVDDYSEVPGVDKGYVLDQENQIIKKVDIVFTVSRLMKKSIDNRLGSPRESKVHYLNNVARFDFYNKAIRSNILPPKDMKSIISNGNPVVGFMGNLASYKENIELLTEVAERMKDVNFVFIGPVGAGEQNTDIASLEQLPNTYLLGPKSYSHLPNYFSTWDVAVIARRLNKANEGGFPLKYFEYLSSGLPVVVTGISSLREFSENPNLGSVADTSEEFIKALRYWIDIKRNNRKRWEEMLKIRIAIAKDNSWEKRMKDFDRIISKFL